MRSEPTRSTVPPRSIHIERATAADARAIADVLTEGFDGGGWLEALTRPFWHYALYDDARNRLGADFGDYALWLATHGSAPSQPLGTVELSVRPFGSWNRDTWFWQVGRERFPYVANLAVIPAARRRGIASRLLDRCERAAADWGYDRIYLHALANNDRAVQLYRQRGYRVQKSEAGVQQWWASSGQLLMRKLLPQTEAPADRAAAQPASGFPPA
ncbi:MAG: GNAT family N-acetyltransferase [Geitlerinemataceae cyanobacterium]